MIQFTVPGNPVPKPRMTKRDVWMKRPCVLAYRDYCDRIREAATGNPLKKLDADEFVEIVVLAMVPIPRSWSLKKQMAAAGTLHRSQKDTDNILKAVKDALFGQDAGIAIDHVAKIWWSEPSTQIMLLRQPGEWNEQIFKKNYAKALG